MQKGHSENKKNHIVWPMRLLGCVTSCDCCSREGILRFPFSSSGWVARAQVAGPAMTDNKIGAA